MTIAAGATDCSTSPSLSKRIFDAMRYDNPWQASQSGVTVGAVVCPTVPNGFGYRCTAITSGITGSSEPTWPTTLTNTVVDGGVTWTCQDVSNPSSKAHPPTGSFGYVSTSNDLDGFRLLAYDIAKAIAVALDTDKVDLGSQVSGTLGLTSGAVSLQASTPGTQQTGHFSISGTGLIGASLGLGTTTIASADGSAHTLQIGDRTIFQSVVGTQTLLSNNAHYDGSWKYQVTDFASAIRFNGLGLGGGVGGDITFHTAPSGTAGNTITNWDSSNVRMVIRNDGSVGIGPGNTAPGDLLDINYSQNGSTGIRITNGDGGASAAMFLRFTDNTRSSYVGMDGNGSSTTRTDKVYLYNNSAGVTLQAVNAVGIINFITGADSSANERMRIDAAGAVGIGTTPTRFFDVAADGPTVPMNQFTAYSGGNVFSNGAGVGLRGARGTQASPSAIKSGDLLGAIAGYGYDSSTFFNPGDTGGSVTMLLWAAQDFTTTHHGTYITFETTPNNSVTRAERVRISSTGNVTVGSGGDRGSPFAAQGLPVYANNAAAVTGGLSTGAFYRTGADPDPVCVVH